MFKKILSRRGFTIVEVLVAFVIFSIMAAMIAMILNTTMRTRQGNIDLENEIKTDEEKLEHGKLIILEAIGKIEEPEYQTILISRYFKHQTWDEIANSLFYTKRWLYSLHGRALEKLDEKLMES